MAWTKVNARRGRHRRLKVPTHNQTGYRDVMSTFKRGKFSAETVIQPIARGGKRRRPH